MEVTHLRIGNWVNYQDDSDGKRYDLQFSIGHFMGIFEGNYGLPEPIELNKDWLVKFTKHQKKFEQRGNGADYQPQHYISYEGFDYHLTDSLFIRDVVFRWPDVDAVIQEQHEGFSVFCNNEYIRNIEHVHKMQNICFELTNEELEIVPVHNSN